MWAGWKSLVVHRLHPSWVALVQFALNGPKWINQYDPVTINTDVLANFLVFSPAPRPCVANLVFRRDTPRSGIFELVDLFVSVGIGETEFTFDLSHSIACVVDPRVYGSLSSVRTILQVRVFDGVSDKEIRYFFTSKLLRCCRSSGQKHTYDRENRARHFAMRHRFHGVVRANRVGTKDPWETNTQAASFRHSGSVVDRPCLKISRRCRWQLRLNRS